jgi:hypothetical protein
MPESLRFGYQNSLMPCIHRVCSNSKGHQYLTKSPAQLSRVTAQYVIVIRFQHVKDIRLYLYRSRLNNPNLLK